MPKSISKRLANSVEESLDICVPYLLEFEKQTVHGHFEVMIHSIALVSVLNYVFVINRELQQGS